MSDPTEADLRALIGTDESMTLEFKRGDLLDKDPNKVAEELSKAISGFANAIGGRIIVGMAEKKNGKRGIADALTGVASRGWTAHRLQQLVESNVEPPLRLRLYRVPLPSIGPEMLAFVIDVPEGTTAYQAKDGLYYARSEYEAKPLRDYEIRLRMNRGTALSARLEASLTLRRSTERLQAEQIEDHLAESAGLQSALPKDLQLGAERVTSPPPISVSTWSQAEKQLVLQQLIPRVRFDEVRLAISLSNSGERTIREYDMHLDFDFPPDWLVFRRDDVQPRGGFLVTDEASANKLQQDQIISANTTFGTSRRLLPQATALVGTYFLLVPEGARMTDSLGTLRWRVHLDNSLPSRGDIDLIPDLRSVLHREATGGLRRSEQ